MVDVAEERGRGRPDDQGRERTGRTRLRSEKRRMGRGLMRRGAATAELVEVECARTASPNMPLRCRSSREARGDETA